MARPAGQTTERGRRWLTQIVDARQKVEAAEKARDEVVREALQDGLGVRGVAAALKIDKATVSRRYGAAGRR